MKNVFGKIITFLIYALVFLFPIFFLNTTQEYFLTNKFYLLGFGLLLILSVVTIDFLINKKLSWKKSSFDNAVFLFLFANLITLVIVVPNRVDALLNTTTGLAMIAFLAALYMIVGNVFKHKERKNLLNVLNWPSIILSIIAIVFFFNPFKNVSLPTALQFLKSSTFTPIGSQFDMMVYIGFFTVLLVGKLFTKNNLADETKVIKKGMLDIFSIFISIIALILTGYSLYKANFSLPPFSVTWYAAIETLKSPLTLLFGVGQGNFINLFTQIKPAVYNQTAYWNLNFSQGSNFVLQLWAELGLLGLFAFLSMLYMVFKKALRNYKVDKTEQGVYFACIYLILVFFLLPTSISAIFLLFIMLTQFTEDEIDIDSHFDTGKVLPLYFISAVLAISSIAASVFFLSKAYVAEAYYKKSLDGYAANKANDFYENQRQAVITNPYSEKYRLAFSQANLLIANNLAAKQKDQITDADRQTITQAIQSGIDEAKAVVSINPGKSSNWENLALIYRNILNVAQGADAWTISAYQRAILTDPNNPILRLNLGGVYFSLQNYDEAINLFTQSIGLKPDWPNAHYNLAYAYFQKKDYQNAASQMQATLTLLDPKSDDYKKAQSELDKIKELLPKEETKTDNTSITGKELALPTPPVATISPKIKLPKESSPEAK